MYYLDGDRRLMPDAPETKAEARARAKAHKDEVVAYLNQVAPVTARGMFGGFGLYTEGVMFALIAYEVLYFKIDDENRGDYELAGMGPFTYTRNGKAMAMSYYQLPDKVYADLGLLYDWLEKSAAAARRGKRMK
jgi:DNA transformation protein